MNTSDINTQLNYLDCFIGTFSRDYIPRKVSKLPAALVVNTDPHYRPGQHWVAIYIDKNGNGDYFDSYGMPPLYKEIKEFLEDNCNRWCYSTQMLQNIIAVTCGAYCVFYIKLRCLGYTHCDFIKLFTNRTYINDKIVAKLFNEFNK